MTTNELVNSLKHLGQQPYNSGSPAGYSDHSADWNGASALYARIQWSIKFAKQYPRQSIENLIDNSFSEQLGQHTSLIVKRAIKHHQRISLLLMSPEFMYR